jgi:hypothetical protein
VVGSGCGASVQSILSAQAEVHVTTHGARVALYEDYAARCEASPDMAAWEACMAPALTVARTADAYRHALLAAQSAVRLGAPEADVLPCVLEAARGLVAALTAAGAEMPPEVVAVVALDGGTCNAR